MGDSIWKKKKNSNKYKPFLFNSLFIRQDEHHWIGNESFFQLREKSTNHHSFSSYNPRLYSNFLDRGRHPKKLKIFFHI